MLNKALSFVKKHKYVFTFVALLLVVYSFMKVREGFYYVTVDEGDLADSGAGAQLDTGDVGLLTIKKPSVNKQGTTLGTVDGGAGFAAGRAVARTV